MLIFRCFISCDQAYNYIQTSKQIYKVLAGSLSCKAIYICEQFEEKSAI